MIILRSAIDAMVAAAARAHPDECCGLLFGRFDRIEAVEPTRNVASEPGRYFEIDPQALIDAYRAERRGGRRLIGYYHSHPTGFARPSAVDGAQASGDGRVWAIVAAAAVTLWRDAGARFDPLSYNMVDE